MTCLFQVTKPHANDIATMIYVCVPWRQTNDQHQHSSAGEIMTLTPHRFSINDLFMHSVITAAAMTAILLVALPDRMQTAAMHTQPYCRSSSCDMEVYITRLLNRCMKDWWMKVLVNQRYDSPAAMSTANLRRAHTTET